MRTVLLILAGLLALPLAAGAKTVNIEYILDASGSMIELMGSDMKIDIAKRTLADLVDKLPGAPAEVDLNVGLRIYGHRTGAAEDPEIGCKDTALEIPIKGVDVQGIKDKILGVKARGRTPIAYSLLQAKDDFPEGDGNENIIILISDGKETCGGDPCKVAEELHKSGIKLKIHVVGFDIKPEERAQLECIAKVTGGKYFAADSAAELSKALSKAQEQVLKKESVSVRIKAVGPGTLRLAPASWVAGEPYYFRVVSAADGKEIARGSSLQDLMLPPGTYRLVWRQWEHGSGEADLGTEFTLEPGKTTTLRLDTGIHLAPAKWVAGAPYYWYLKNPESGKEVLRVSGKWEAVLAPPGTYELWYRQWQHGSNEVCLSKTVKIEKGKCTEFDVNTGVKILPADPQMKEPYNWVLKDKKTGDQAVSVGYKWGPVPVPPGNYSLSLRQTEHGHSLIELVPELPVKEGQLVEIEL
ncbi:MAG: VWA domain-containing protein [Candidatus Tritonobacter lacicola]|nr:VWA domain-containing protein [Candidatus Tritonobacter lacicola]